MNRKPKILVLGGSIRSGSHSQQLADAYASKLAGLDCMITRITLKDYFLPMMDEDLQKTSGIPENAVKLARLFHGSDAIVIVTPEYNGSLPPLLKNAIDWISRVSTNNGSPVIAYRNKLCARFCVRQCHDLSQENCRGSQPRSFPARDRYGLGQERVWL